ncbi:MAG TPA: NAD-dependent epimerase/dehydratase family protein [Ramlibacter sp.]|uniref:NAD-dependent epimerase/dehydratase family protein n=1 Tax=Ramlibacter sp. TaxID=1917967 RepID=UPI002D2BF5E8|nr:NAD-dependent epimerase/dehydratase family protein [Ramlibacter sp.]HZY19951.1 NAD-dependent epimerase/dehydratase family protein [Ramlibacter sp.]
MTGRVLVTGATGGLGRVLVPALRELGWQVVATGRRAEAPPEWSAPGIAYRPADLACDPLQQLTDGVDTVFHLAALSAPWGKPEAFAAANVTATQRLLDAARVAGCPAFIHVATPSIYTEARDRLELTEASLLPRRWPNDYARTKFAAERLVAAAASSGMATVVLRPRAIVSPFDTVLLPRLLRAARSGTLVLPHGGRALVELTDARDVVSALVAARTRSQALRGQAFNISGGMPLPLGQVAALVFRLLDRPVRIRSVPRRVALAVASVAERVAATLPGRPEPALTRYGAMVAGWSQTFDLTAARESLDWRPHHAPQEALAWALAGMRHA